MKRGFKLSAFLVKPIATLLFLFLHHHHQQSNGEKRNVHPICPMFLCVHTINTKQGCENAPYLYRWSKTLQGTFNLSTKQ